MAQKIVKKGCGCKKNRSSLSKPKDKNNGTEERTITRTTKT